MELEVETFCPLGKKCQTAEDGVIKQCAWYVKLEGKNPQNGERVDEHKCSMSWLPLLMIEGNGVAMNTNASIQSMRNETIKRQDLALGVMANAKAIESD